MSFSEEKCLVCSVPYNRDFKRGMMGRKYEFFYCKECGDSMRVEQFLKEICDEVYGKDVVNLRVNYHNKEKEPHH